MQCANRLLPKKHQYLELDIKTVNKNTENSIETAERRYTQNVLHRGAVADDSGDVTKICGPTRV